MSVHVDDLASLYVLGALDNDARASVEEHVASCNACARALADASDELASVEAALPLVEPPRELGTRIESIFDRAAVRALPARTSRAPWYLGAAVAAAIVFGVAPSTYLWQANHQMDDEMVANSAALSRIMTSPHKMARFASMTDARVMYGPNGSWYCVIIRGARGPVEVAWKHGGQTTMLGKAIPHGDIAMLYLPDSHRMDQLALMDGPQTLGQARLLF